MQAGKLRHRVSLQELARNQSVTGEMIPSYAPYATVWASVEPLTGRELEFAQQITAETNYRVTIRYNSKVDVEHRVVFGDNTFEVTSVVNPDERNEQLFLMCKEVK